MADDRSEASQEARGPEASPPRPKGLALHWKILIGLALGAVGGLLANALLPHQEDGSPNPQLTAIAYYVADPIGQVFQPIRLQDSRSFSALPASA